MMGRSISDMPTTKLVGIRSSWQLFFDDLLTSFLIYPGTRPLLCPSTRSRLKFSWKVVYFNPGCWVLLFVLSTKKQRQQFCNNKKKTHYLLNLSTRRTLFINFNLATFLYISVSYILWSTAGKCWDLRRPWHRFQCTMEASFLPSNGGLPI